MLLTLLSLPPSTATPAVAGTKQRKSKKDPERSAATLDPELLLDFLTDRLNIWRVMKDVKSLGVLDLPTQTAVPGGEKVVAEETKDEVQVWWEDVVERL